MHGPDRGGSAQERDEQRIGRQSLESFHVRGKSTPPACRHNSPFGYNSCQRKEQLGTVVLGGGDGQHPFRSSRGLALSHYVRTLNRSVTGKAMRAFGRGKVGA